MKRFKRGYKGQSIYGALLYPHDYNTLYLVAIVESDILDTLFTNKEIQQQCCTYFKHFKNVKAYFIF